MSDISKNSIEIDAPAEAVRETLFAIESYPTWSKATTSAEVVEKDDQGRATKVKIGVNAGVVKDNVVLDYDWSKAPDQVSFSFDDADLLTDMYGSFLIKDNGDETTTVTYELTVALSMPVPAMMRQKQERTTIDFTLAQLKAKVEA